MTQEHQLQTEIRGKYLGESRCMFKTGQSREHKSTYLLRKRIPTGGEIRNLMMLLALIIFPLVSVKKIERHLID